MNARALENPSSNLFVETTPTAPWVRDMQNVREGGLLSFTEISICSRETDKLGAGWAISISNVPIDK